MVWNAAPRGTHPLVWPWRAHGITAVCVKVNEGAMRYAGARGTNYELVKQARAAGYLVGGWGYLREGSFEEAKLIAELVAEHRLAFYVADAEGEFAHEGAAASAQYARSARFTEQFRALHELAKLPAAVTSYGRPSLHPLDWAAWQLAGFRFLPQCYWNESSALRPSLCVADARRHGITLDRLRRRRGAVSWSDRRFVHPMLGCYSGARGRVSPVAYVDDLRVAGTRGFSIYSADEATDGDYTALSRAR